MKNKISFIIAILMANIAISQTQFSIYSGINLSNVSTNDFNNTSNGVGLNFGIALASILSEKSDLILEMGYEHKTFNAASYNDFYNNKITLRDPITANNIVVNALYNYYILTPENASFYLTAQGGLGITAFSKWNSKDSEFNSTLEGAGHFNPYYIVGTTIGFENLRVTVRYNKSFGNVLSGAYIQSLPDSFNSTNDRQLNATLSYFSLNLTYLYNLQM